MIRAGNDKGNRGGPTPRSWKKKLLTVLLATAVALICGELGLRLFWHNPYRAEAPDKMLRIRIQHANMDHHVDRSPLGVENPQVRFRTDGRSYILPSFQYENADATIAFLGGSTTECVAVEEELRFPALVSTKLAQKGWKVNTLNAARSGNTIHDSLNVLLNHVIEDRPDIVVLMHATNDAGVLRARGDYRSRCGSHVSLRDLAKWSLQMASRRLYLAGIVRRGASSAIFQTDTADGPRRQEPAAAAPPSEEYRRRLLAFVHLCRDFGIEPVLMTQPLAHFSNLLTPGWAKLESQDEFNAMIRSVGREEGALVIDLVTYLKENCPEWSRPMEVFYDGMHVTDKGSKIYAEYIAEQLQPLLRKKTL